MNFFFNFPVPWEFQVSKQTVREWHKGDSKVLQSVISSLDDYIFLEEIVSKTWMKEGW